MKITKKISCFVKSKCNNTLPTLYMSEASCSCSELQENISLNRLTAKDAKIESESFIQIIRSKTDLSGCSLFMLRVVLLSHDFYSCNHRIMAAITGSKDVKYSKDVH